MSDDTGWAIAGSGTTDSSIGTESWFNPSYVTAEDSNDAAATSAAPDEQTYYIKGYNFGLSVPTGSTIDGIEIRGVLRDDVQCAYLNYARIYHPSSGVGTNLATSQTLNNIFSNYDFGGPTELHGLSWTYSDVNSSSFAVLFSANASSARFGSMTVAGNPRCDAIYVKVYYTDNSGLSASALTQGHIFW